MVAVLGAVTCVLALYALARPIVAANAQRSERSRFAVEQEVRRLRSTPEDGAKAHPESAMFGMRSGLIDATASFDDMQPPLETDTVTALREARDESIGTGNVALREGPAGGGTLFVAAAPGEGHHVAWAAYFMKPPRWTPVLRVVGVLLGLVSLALVVASLHAVITVQREAGSLKQSLRALAKDLNAPVPRPAVTELGDVAEGIEALARELAASGRERERLNVELAERERLAVLGRVTAGVAHELRNPLALIKLRVDVACRKVDDPASMVRELGDVGEEIARLDRLANDLLTVGGRRTGPKSLSDLGDLVRRRAALMDPLLAERGVRLTVAGTARAPLDVDAICRVIDNLQQNAVEASSKDSEVRVEVTVESQQAVVRVIDSGPGVLAGREAELFEPFFTTKPEGVGLGLALCRAIAAGHRGSLTYRRENDRTVFELKLPTTETVPT